MNLRSVSRARAFRVMATIAAFAVVFVIGAALHGAGSIKWPGWAAVLHSALLFSVLGAFYGTIVALDGSAAVSQHDHPVWRVIMGAILGVVAVWIVQAWSSSSFTSIDLSFGALIGAILGWFGWSWLNS